MILNHLKILKSSKLNAHSGVFLLTTMTILYIIVIEVRKLERRMFMLKTYCPKEDHEVEKDWCETCRFGSGFDVDGYFIECEWGDDNGLDSQ